MVFLFCEVTVEATHVGHVGHLVFLCLCKIFPLCLLCMHVFADGSCIYFSIVHACMHMVYNLHAFIKHAWKVCAGVICFDGVMFFCNIYIHT